jgi:hypothetical protein
MYGAEYDSHDLGVPYGNDVPCAVCRSTIGLTVLTIPGKSTCYSGWTIQYHGDLVAGAYSHKAATQYICLDEHPEALTAGQDDNDGKLIYPVRAVCGSLACPPYHNGRYLTCVVCTKWFTIKPSQRKLNCCLDWFLAPAGEYFIRIGKSLYWCRSCVNRDPMSQQAWPVMEPPMLKAVSAKHKPCHL